MAGDCSTHGRDEKCIANVSPKAEGKRLLGTSRRRMEDNIRMDLREIGWELVDRIHLT
jgi:hypothetical protein